MVKFGRWCVIVSVLTVGAASVSADLMINQIEVKGAVGFGVEADYLVGPKTLAWSAGTAATVYTSAGNFTFDDITVDVVFGSGVDLSGGTIASARFTSVDSALSPGSWYMRLNNNSLGMSIEITGGLVISEGGCPWGGYYEYEDLPGTNHLLGRAWLSIDPSTDVVCNGFSMPVVWDTNIYSGIRASTTLANNIDDYQSDWDSDNVILTIVTNEQAIVPEPATLGLLGLGGGLLFWRRKHA